MIPNDFTELTIKHLEVSVGQGKEATMRLQFISSATASWRTKFKAKLYQSRIFRDMNTILLNASAGSLVRLQAKTGTGTIEAAGSFSGHLK